MNAVASMQRGPMELERMQWIACGVVLWIVIEGSGFNGSLNRESNVNEVDFMQHGPKHPD